ncbi:hypothetical protein FIU94_13600 [Sulfitobacter sp. THAF37]|uniref:DUF2177 family protein n=1 Tax=Sulfitobacter sp. THAF37 TaxID=2587855 RepID=UPI001268C7BE|nr:DUF2177 family protein [Sulfitobacter sp. THAF37]QFT59863.1 hypothetical protein FIU94_13600 [Sulfitobacter sp. THAF37]
MTLAVLYLSTFILFLGLDYVGLTNIVKPVFERDIGPLLLENFRLGPAVVFYAFYVGVLLWFVSWPAITQDRSLLWVLGNAALIGAMGYGTYEFTSLAVMKDWTWQMTLTDVTWGTCLTAIAATGGVWVARLVG